MNDSDYLQDDDEIREQVLRRLRTDGLRIAVEAAIQVASDTKAPAPARATAAGLIMRGAGILERGAQEAVEKPPHEMTRAELDRHWRRTQRAFERQYAKELKEIDELDSIAQAQQQQQQEPDIFG